MGDASMLHHDLSAACSYLGVLISTSQHFVPEEEWRKFADEMRPHLVAAAGVMGSYCERFSELIRFQSEERIDEVVMLGMGALRHYLAGRTSIEPGDSLNPDLAREWKIIKAQRAANK